MIWKKKKKKDILFFHGRSGRRLKEEVNVGFRPRNHQQQSSLSLTHSLSPTVDIKDFSHHEPLSLATHNRDSLSRYSKKVQSIISHRCILFFRPEAHNLSAKSDFFFGYFSKSLKITSDMCLQICNFLWISYFEKQLIFLFEFVLATRTKNRWIYFVCFLTIYYTIYLKL